MRFIPLITLGLWLTLVGGYVVARPLLLSPYILLPLFLLLSVLLPICFWTLQFEKRRVYSLLFAGIFIFNCLFLGGRLVEAVMQVSGLEPYRNLVIHPEQAEKVYSAEKEQTRINISRYIYENSGVVMAYSRQSGELALYQPTDLDKSVLAENYDRHRTLVYGKKLLIYNLWGVVLLLGLHLLIFTGVLIYLILLEGPAGRNREQEG